MKYICYIDYQVSNNKPYEYRSMESTNLADAILEADTAWDINTMYLMRIMEKEGRTETRDGAKFETYTARLCKRSDRWYENTIENAENEHKAERVYFKSKPDNRIVEWFESK